MGLEKIAEYKKRLGITTEELSSLSGIPIGTLNKLLSGQTKDPKLETLKSLARVFNCTLDDFDDKDNVEVSPEYSESVHAYEELESLVARNGKILSSEQKIRLIQLLSEIRNKD